MKIERKPTQNRRRGLLTGAVAAVAIVIAVLVMTACQPAEQPAAAQVSGGNGQRPNFQMQPAPELPTTQPAVRGFVVSHDANSLIVQIGNPNFRQGQGGGQRPTPSGTPRPRPTQVGEGTDVTVTLSSSTVVYQDVTFANSNGQPPSGTIQQKVEKSTLDALSDNMRVTVWGDQNGDQIAATVIVYSQFRGGPQQQQPTQ